MGKAGICQRNSKLRRVNPPLTRPRKRERDRKTLTRPRVPAVRQPKRPGNRIEPTKSARFLACPPHSKPTPSQHPSLPPVSCQGHPHPHSHDRAAVAKDIHPLRDARDRDAGPFGCRGKLVPCGESVKRGMTCSDWNAGVGGMSSPGIYLTRSSLFRGVRCFRGFVSLGMSGTACSFHGVPVCRVGDGLLEGFGCGVSFGVLLVRCSPPFGCAFET